MTPEIISADELAAEVLREARRAGAARTLVLDVDGTLAPIVPTPEAAAVPGSTLTAIRRLLRVRWRIVVVSGRPVAQVSSMVPIDGISAFGSHGLERLVDGECRRRPIPAARSAQLARWVCEFGELAAGFPGVRIEKKPVGLALHDRQLAAGRRPEWHARIREWLVRQDLSAWEILEGRRVLEIRPAGVDKGDVVRQVVRDLDCPSRDGSFVALGDDRTDEDMFRAIAPHGLAVVVGTREPSVAVRRLGSPADVGDFLGRLTEAEERRE